MTRRLFVSMIAAAVWVAWSPALGAHPGHGHKVLGTVMVINGNHVELKDADGKKVMHMLDAKTKIRRGKTVMRASDLKVGDRVVLSVTEVKDKAGKVTMTVTEVQLAATPAGTTGMKK
ncbi:MAG TPA: hypothetical protein VNJ02_15825 [Vicinamibacterales bacterium]|nr:hypothetical protein [Vicinamibacterales bacterium]